MLTQLRLVNFRRFSDHTVQLRPTTVIVGKNNAGKSTIVEALRLISIVTERYTRITYRKSPEWVPTAERFIGIQPSIRGLEIDPDGLFHLYEDPPGRIEATFASGAKLRIHLGPEAIIHAVIQGQNRRYVRSKDMALGTPLPSVGILPQIGPLQKEEFVLQEEYVRRTASTALSSAHFRNQLVVFRDSFEEFRRLAEETWPEIKISDLTTQIVEDRQKIHLQVRNGEFVGEVALMGHGLQVWLQTLWFLVRTGESNTTILDEPDVYLHADLQRRLFRRLRERPGQLIVTTHSTEILSEVQPEDVLVIDHRLAQSEYATSVEAVQKVVYAFGSIHNIQLARLVQSRRFILVEGDDIPLLKAIHDILYPNNESLDTIPNTDVGGWGGWNYAIGFSKGFKNSLKQDITIYCIFDKDYHTSQEIENRYNQAIQESIQLHIWRKKEIENYLLVPSAICRYIQHRANADAPPITSEAVFTEIKSISERLRNNICDKIASEYFKNFRSTGVDLVTAMEHARSVVDLACQEPEGIVQIAPGKQVISTLSAWAHARFGVSLTPMRLASALRHDEVHPEIEQLLTTIHRGGAFLSRSHDTQ